ncbi:Efflux pump FUS6 [Rhodotorula toruloides]|nr:Efflux pump FUS6 [Rhodotorula toruloides]
MQAIDELRRTGETPASERGAVNPAPDSAELEREQKGQVGERAENQAEGGRKGMRFWLIYLSLLLATFEAAVEQTALSTALPTIADDLHSTSPSWVANSFMIASAAAIPWSGGLAYIFGRRPVMLAGLGLFSLGSIVGGAAKNMTTMLAGRGIQGAGAGVIFAIVEIILSDLVPLSERGLYQAGFSATWSFASATGPLIGGAFASFDYRWLFWINPIMSLPIALCCVWVMKLKGPEDDMREKLAKMDCPRPPTDRIGNLVFIPSMSVLILGIVWGGVDHPWRSAHVLATIVCGAAGLVAWFFIEKHWVKHPTVPFAAILNKTSLIGFVTTFLHGIVTMCVYYLWPAYFQSAKAASTIRSAVDFLPVVGLVSPVAVITGFSTNYLQAYKPQNIVGFVLLTVGVGLLALTTEATSTAGWVLIPMVVALGIGVIYAATVFPVLAPLPPDLAGQALAFQMLVRTFGMVLGTSIGLTVITNGLGKHLPQAYLDMVPDGVAGAYSSIPLIRTLEEPLKTEVRHAFAQALRIVWLVMVPFAGLALILSFFMDALPLNTAKDENFGVKQKKGGSPDDVEKADVPPAVASEDAQLYPTVSIAEATVRMA